MIINESDYEINLWLNDPHTQLINSYWQKRIVKFVIKYCKHYDTLPGRALAKAMLIFNSKFAWTNKVYFPDKMISFYYTY